jgi:hypothetical protein
MKAVSGDEGSHMGLMLLLGMEASHGEIDF